MSLTPELWELKEEIEVHARAYGLDFFETIFEVVDYDRINELAAFGGFPTRYPHWRFGMEYEQLSRSTEYGLSKIYEMVINTDPAYAYLLEGNRLVDQRTVIAHVFGHVDFFKNNYYFSPTNRKMIDQMANHATRVRRLVDRLGVEKIEEFIDTCLSIDNLIDAYSPYMVRAAARSSEAELSDREVEVTRLPARGYMDEFINPRAYLDKQREDKKREIEARKHRFPEEPQRDVLHFLLENAPLESWELDILNIIRTEAYYFAPQGMTKIMNEGWATYWHSKILTEKSLRDSEVVDYAEAYAGVVAQSPKRLNPYKLGVELWRDIEHRWNRGMFGSEWESCNVMAQRESWNKELGLGRDKIFQVRALYNDVTFVDEFLTEEFVERNNMYTFGFNPKTKKWEITSKDFKEIKTRMLDQLTNFGQPNIAVRDANFRNRSELLLTHKFTGEPLRVDYAREVLVNLFRVWKRPVFIETLVEDRWKLVGFDGRDHTEKAWEPGQDV